MKEEKISKGGRHEAGKEGGKKEQDLRQKGRKVERNVKTD